MEMSWVNGMRYPLELLRFSDKGWYYISYKECWNKIKLEDGVYKCPRCPTVIPLPSFRFIARAVDAGSLDPHTAKFTDFCLFGTRGNIVIGKKALLLVSMISPASHPMMKMTTRNTELMIIRLQEKYSDNCLSVLTYFPLTCFRSRCSFCSR